MSEWVELKYIKNDQINKCAARSYSISEVEATGAESCRVYFDDHNHCWDIAESYDEVMQKIHKSEEPVTVPVAEHFTPEEYERILDAMNRPVSPSEATQKIIDKLEEILKEYK